MSELGEVRAYGRKMFERAVVAEADAAALEDRLAEALAQNDALRAELGMPAGRRCYVCRALCGADTLCRPCQHNVSGRGPAPEPLVHAL